VHFWLVQPNTNNTQNQSMLPHTPARGNLQKYLKANFKRTFVKGHRVVGRLISSPGFPATLNTIATLFFVPLNIPAVNEHKQNKLSYSTQFYALTLHMDVYNCILKPPITVWENEKLRTLGHLKSFKAQQLLHGPPNLAFQKPTI